MLETILKRLELMFKEPQKHLIIGLVKTTMFDESLGDRNDILKAARGEGGEQRSFKGYNVIVVEQD